jgi:hypothetical protein
MKKAFISTLLVLAILMGFVTVQAVWALKGPGCTTVVEGTVTEILYDDNAIVVDNDTIIYGVPVDEWKLDIEESDLVVINAHVCLDTGKLVACYLTVNGDTIIDLRPRASRGPSDPKYSGGKV